MIAGFAVGGLFYTLTVSRFLPRLGVKGMMIAGATLVGFQLAAIAFGPAGSCNSLSMLVMGWGFYMIHGCLQVFASELCRSRRAPPRCRCIRSSSSWARPSARSPMALGLHTIGKIPTLLTSASIMVVLGLVCARLLRAARAGGCA